MMTKDSKLIVIGLVLITLLAFMCFRMHQDDWLKLRGGVIPVAPAVKPPEVAQPFANVKLAGAWDGKTIILRGAVPSDSDKLTIVQRARTLYGDNNVRDEITVGKIGKLSAPSLAGVAQFPPDLRTFISGAALFTEERLRIDGTLPSEAARTAATTALDSFAMGKHGLSLSLVVSSPAAPKTKEELQVRLNKEVEKEIVEFRTGSAELTDKGKAILDRIAALIAGMPKVPIAVQGHTDNQGQADKNQKLSEERSAAVKQYLIGKGVAASQLSTIGFGQTQPKVDNVTPEGRARNRRIEFKLKS